MPGGKILLVEDNADFAELLMFDIKKRGYLVAAASNGEEGLAKVQFEKPQLIIFDIKMPKMDGYTFVKNLKKNPETASIPLMALTAYEPMKDMFEIEGVNHYFLKSAKMDSLFETIARYLPPEPKKAS